MTSNMLAGERKWASARRCGMTVLGKVAVPKPLNLPSQRLENHGLDPNVEIVPKGSLSWGSRPSSSSSNPWGSSTQSPNADGANGSPSHPSGRPSSGGSGTRPSTAGSDRIHESSTSGSVWGPNSRPSSASGALTSNQMSLTPLRPHSAETRPGSSQLSRFAEPLSDNSVAWGPSGTVEKLVIASIKNDGFSLSSGDFPTLGSEKGNSERSTESQDYHSHGRPSSSSGRASTKDRIVSFQDDVKSGSISTSKRDGTEHVDDRILPSSENWQGDQQQYLNPSVPQHFDAWRGPIINAPTGVWYRGPPGGPPYGPPVGPGGFPIEPFPYYRPQIPPPGLGNSHPVPHPGAGPRGHHPTNGDLYRAPIPDAFIHPGMPIRPGLYPRPVPYENYYGPPMGYCNPNERDIPFMGMSAGPSVYNMYPAQNNPDHSNSHARAGGHSSSTVTNSEQVESGNSDDTRGPHKVLMKQHSEWDARKEEGNREHNVPGNVPRLDKWEPSTALRKNEWGADNRRDEDMYSRRTIHENSSRNFDNKGGYPLDSAIVKSPELVDKTKAVDGSWGKKSEIATSSFPEVPQVLSAAPKDSTLLQKIEGLNAKVRASDGRHDVVSTKREEHSGRLQSVTAKANNSTNEVHTAALSSERSHAGDLVSASGEAGVFTGDIINQSTVETAMSRRAHHGVQGRVDHRGKGRYNNQDADGWRKKPLAADLAIPAANTGAGISFHVQDQPTSVEAAENPEINLPGKDEGESLTQFSDPSDNQAQRAKMRELAKQRAIQLQKEEEERIREQKAKALAKLEELNKRSQSGDGSIQKMEKTPPSGSVPPEQEESRTTSEPVTDGSKNEAQSLPLVSSSTVISQTSNNSNSGVGESTVLFRDSHVRSPKNAQQEASVAPSLPSKVDIHNAGTADVKTAHQVNDGSVSRLKRMDHKQKQNTQVEKNLTQIIIPFGTIRAPDILSSVPVKDVASAETVQDEISTNCESKLADNLNILPESSAQQRRKNTRIGKNKNKPEDPSLVAGLPAQMPRETNPAKVPTESGKPKSPHSELDPTSVSVTKDTKQHSEQHFSLHGEEAHIKVNNQWKSQHSRRMPRSTQANRVVDKSHGNDAAVWAPVRSHHKAESADEASQKTVPDAVTVPAKNDNLGQNSLKSKRAEMERYVPKPVAKELAQQVSIQQSNSLSFGETKSDETAGQVATNFQRPVGSTDENFGPSVGSKTGDYKQNKQPKAHGAWRQRGPIETTRQQSVQRGSSLASNLSKNVQQESNPVKTEPNSSEEGGISDGWNIPEYPSEAAATSGMKDQGGVIGKGKRYPFKGTKSTGNKHDLDQTSINSGEISEKFFQSAALEINQTERTVTSKENRGIRERTSHWQPKSQVYSANNQTGRSSGAQHVTSEIGGPIRKDSSPGSRDLPPKQYEECSEADQSVPGNNTVVEATNIKRKEAKRERKVPSFKEASQSPSNDLVCTDDQASRESSDVCDEQHFSSGIRKHGNQSNRSGRGQESHGDWSSVGQDNRQHSVHGNRERQSQNSHYKYQPVGSFNSSRSNNFQGPVDGSRHMGSRYRERGQGQGQGHSRRGEGNSYGRLSGTVQVDAGYD